MDPKTTEAIIAARDAAQQTPPDVRTAMLDGERCVNGITFQPLTLAVLWLLEEIEHPLIRDAKQEGEASAFSNYDTATALFIFSAPRQARTLLSSGREEFDAAAFEMAEKFTPADLPALNKVLRSIFETGLATAPVPGKTANPP